MKKIFIFAIGAIMLMSCNTTKPLYSWYNSEDASYQYMKKMTEDSYNKAAKQYEKVLKKQKGTRKVVPPGTNAEYGYMLYKSGSIERGLELMKKEMQQYPESETFISRIVKQLEK